MTTQIYFSRRFANMKLFILICKLQFISALSSYALLRDFIPSILEQKNIKMSSFFTCFKRNGKSVPFFKKIYTYHNIFFVETHELNTILTKLNFRVNFNTANKFKDLKYNLWRNNYGIVYDYSCKDYETMISQVI